MNAPAGHGATMNTPPAHGDPMDPSAARGGPTGIPADVDHDGSTGALAGHEHGGAVGFRAGHGITTGALAGHEHGGAVGFQAGAGDTADIPAGHGHGGPVGAPGGDGALGGHGGLAGDGGPAGYGGTNGVRAGQGHGPGCGGPGGGGAGGRAAGEVRVTVGEFRLLGPVSVCDTAGGVIAPSGPKQRALLATLVLHAGQLLSVDRLVEELWGGTPPANAPNALQAHVARLRRLLPAPGHEWISTLPTGYLLAPGHASTDVARFTRLSGQGRAALPRDPGQAAQLLQRALSLWRGPALQDSRHGPLCTAEADRLEEQRLTAWEALYEASLQCGRSTEITAGLERLSADHPLRERFYDLLMLALYRSGRQAEALGVYERARRHLITTLGIEPGPALRARLEAILNHSPALTPHTPQHRHPSPAAGPPRPSSPPHPLDPARTADRTDTPAPARASAAAPTDLTDLTARAGRTAPGGPVAPAGPAGRTGQVTAAPAAGPGSTDLTDSAGLTGLTGLTGLADVAGLAGLAGFVDVAGRSGSADLAGELAGLRARIEELARDQQDLLRRIQREQALR
ncbi:AfsR/SARP family transcriptional regulator [Streptomyces sp. NPDC048643]|uniref:AfsR/SARP family transcriptional regulator n=1 Tax=Streptomyces sp. NPDC048643 TaxID=3155637 RepID=UPI003443E24B